MLRGLDNPEFFKPAVLGALAQLGHTVEHQAIFDDLDLLRQKLASFAPDVIFNLADQFKNNRAWDQAMQQGPGDAFDGIGLHEDTEHAEDILARVRRSIGIERFGGWLLENGLVASRNEAQKLFYQ